MIKRVNNLLGLGKFIMKGEPGEVEFDLGSGEEKTGLNVAHIKRSTSVGNRISSDPLFNFYYTASGFSMDLLDSDGGHYYRNMKPVGVEYEPSEGPGDRGTMVIRLAGDKRKLTLNHYDRPPRTVKDLGTTKSN